MHVLKIIIRTIKLLKIIQIPHTVIDYFWEAIELLTIIKGNRFFLLKFVFLEISYIFVLKDTSSLALAVSFFFFPDCQKTLHCLPASIILPRKLNCHYHRVTPLSICLLSSGISSLSLELKILFYDNLEQFPHLFRRSLILLKW